MYADAHMCVSVHVCVRMCDHLYIVFECVSMCAYVCVFTSAWECEHTSVRVNTHVYPFTYMHDSVYKYICVYAHVLLCQ